MPDIKIHRRINDILLGPLERPALRWLAAHTPGWMVPDTMTIIGIIGALIIAVSYGLTNYHKGFLWLASLGFVINWYGDSLDGTLARYRHRERPLYGFFIDHVVDAFNEMVIILGIGLSAYMDFTIACLVLIAYLMMSVLVYVRTCVKGEFVISYAGLGPTEIRVLVIFANTYIFFWGNPTISLLNVQVNFLNLAGILVASLLFLFFLLSSINQARQLARIDP